MQKTNAQRIQAIRVALRAKYGARKYRIVGNSGSEEIHVYGQMPNTTITGWWLMGDLVTAECWMGIDMPAAD